MPNIQPSGTPTEFVTIPKGMRKVISISHKAITENEIRQRSVIGTPRRFVPVVRVQTEAGAYEGFGLTVKGTVRIRYNVMRFPLGSKLGTACTRAYIETDDAVQLAMALENPDA